MYFFFSSLTVNWIFPFSSGFSLFTSDDIMSKIFDIGSGNSVEIFGFGFVGLKYNENIFCFGFLCFEYVCIECVF